MKFFFWIVKPIWYSSELSYYDWIFLKTEFSNGQNVDGIILKHY